MQDCHYKIAELVIKVLLPDSVNADALLPSFVPFVATETSDVAFVFDATRTVLLPDGLDMILSEDSDMGETRIYDGDDSWWLTFTLDGETHVMTFDKDYSYARAGMKWEDPDVGMILTSMIRTMFAQNVILHDGISMHSSTVILDGKAFMFMGTSGTGKSTHSRLWMSVFPGCGLLNDDNPIVRMIGGTAMAYGSPWSGKTPCYRNMNAEVAGIVRLSQARQNCFRRLEDVNAFVEIYKGCSVLRADESLHDLLCDNLTAVVDSVIVGHLACLPDEDAARLCHTILTEEK